MEKTFIPAHKVTVSNPIGTVDGFVFYEDPIMGDEAPLMAVKDGIVYRTEYWELPESL